MARSEHITCNVWGTVVWGWIHLHGIREVAEIEGRFTSEKYIETLEEVMLPTFRAFALSYP